MSAPAARVIEPPSWLDVIEGDAPILLIAPHGGRAGAASRATLHPKVNDLETAAITRDLTGRLSAAALINSGMDRNEIDCNRLSQVAARAPWILDLIADRVSGIIARHGRATVLLIHGWNVIEPRIDFGLGLRHANGRLRPPAGAHVSASDEFIHGPVAELFARLSAAGIIPTFGLRYPGGASQNLLQAFTQRHSGTELEALRRLAQFAVRGAIDALQLEMSVAVRLAGPIRTRGLDALAEVFRCLQDRTDRTTPRYAKFSKTDPIAVHRDATPPIAREAVAAPPAPPVRVGIEFYDVAARIGGMTSFDFGAGAAGARIMMLFDHCCAALFTGEGKPTRDGGHLRLGPLELTIDSNGGRLNFRGPAVIVNNGAAYLSVENALADSRLDSDVTVAATIELEGDQGTDSTGGALDGLIARALGAATNGKASGGATAVFGRLRGAIVLGGVRREINAVARIGASFTGLEPQRFETRRMLWACFPDTPELAALEARAWTFAEDSARGAARLFCDGEWRESTLASIQLETPAPGAPPDPFIAMITNGRGDDATLRGTAEAFMTLSRPGPDHCRIHTSIGFASFRLGTSTGAGMFEYSRIASAASADSDDEENDSD
ncbi:MAG: hypothetical protein QOG61_1078 [Candidatus Binataceae bacterium]|nr:hypothetical protein [Candidatus Binataceae bacterium]